MQGQGDAAPGNPHGVQIVISADPDIFLFSCTHTLIHLPLRTRIPVYPHTLSVVLSYPHIVVSSRPDTSPLHTLTPSYSTTLIPSALMIPTPDYPLDCHTLTTPYPHTLLPSCTHDSRVPLSSDCHTLTPHSLTPPYPHTLWPCYPLIPFNPHTLKPSILFGYETVTTARSHPCNLISPLLLLLSM